MTRADLDIKIDFSNYYTLLRSDLAARAAQNGKNIKTKLTSNNKNNNKRIRMF